MHDWRIHTKECTENEHWVNSYTRIRNGKLEAVSSYCSPDTYGYKLWLPRFSNNRPLRWPNKKEVSQRWPIEQREQTLKAIGKIPTVIWPTHEIGIYRMKTSKHGSINAGSNNINAIALYDSAFASDELFLVRVLTHEFAHRFWLKLSEEQHLSYYRAAQWVVIESDFTDESLVMPLGKNFIYDDGNLSPEEDFSNNIEAFLLENEKLKTMSPQVHKWISGFFNDKFKLK